VFINDPIMVPQVLGSKAFGKFDRGVLFSMAQPLVGGSFLAAPDGDTWKYQRRLVQRGFSQKSLAETTRTTTELLEKELFSAWDEYAGTSNPISVLPWMQRMAIDVLGRVAFSHSFDGVASFAPPQSRNLIEVAEKINASTADGSGVSLYEAFTVISTEITKRSQNPLRKLLPNGKYKNACQTFNNTISDVVELRFKLLLEQSAQTGGAKSADSLPTDLLSYLVQKDETGHVLEQKAIVGNIRMFLFTGQDTTASSLSFCLWYIAKHEKVQERLYNEINSLMTQRSGSSSRLSDAELRKLPYLDAVLKEALRLCSPAAVAREALQDVTVTNACGQSYVLPKGVQVHITSFVLQRSPRYWPDRPLEFVPERHYPLRR
jgi:cytochrome P450